MILVDMNQISLASVMMHLNTTKRDSVDVGMVRHMVSLLYAMTPRIIGEENIFQNTKLEERSLEKHLVMIGMIFLSV